MRLTPLQLARTRLHLFLSGIRKRLTVGCRAVLVDGDRVLLVKHTYLPGWHFPGGGVEPGETTAHAAAREALEETGYAPLGEPRLLGLYLNRLAGMSRDHVAVHVFTRFEQKRAFVPNFEIAACGWFGVSELPADIDEGTARRLDELFEQRPPTAEW